MYIDNSESPENSLVLREWQTCQLMVLTLFSRSHSLYCKYFLQFFSFIFKSPVLPVLICFSLHIKFFFHLLQVFCKKHGDSRIILQHTFFPFLSKYSVSVFCLHYFHFLLFLKSLCFIQFKNQNLQLSIFLG